MAVDTALGLDVDTSVSRRTLAVSVALVLALLVVPFTTTSYVTSLVMLAMVYAMLAVAWNLLAGYAGQISLGHAAFFGLGAYVTAWFASPSGADLPAAMQLHPFAALLLGGVGAALVALVLGPVMFRLRGHYFAIGTLALATIIQLVLADQRELSGGSTGYYLHSSVGPTATYLATVVVAVAVVVGVFLVVRSRLGLAMLAVHDDETAASGLGVSPLRYKMYAFVITSFCAGIAGGAYALNSLYVAPASTLGVTWTIDTLVVVILGGMGTLSGPLLGAVVFMVLDNFLTAVVGDLATTVEGLVIILFVVFLPAGIRGYLDRYLDDDGGDGSAGDADAAAD